MAVARLPRVVLALVAAGSTGLAGACARQGSPPGGPEDRRPPVVVTTSPEPFEVLTEPFRGPVRFRFDERVSERVSGGTLDDAVLVSPRTGAVRARHGRQDISVDIAGGFKPGLVYRVTLQPVIRDLFNNQMRDPFEFVFSTGGEFTASAVAGLVWDRTTGEGIRDLDVLAVAVNEEGDSTVYVARTDTGGVYVLRYLPPSRYTLVAFEDRNQNDVVDRMEVQGSRGLLLSGADTAIVPIGVLQPDTTPARLTRATPLDSLTLLLAFDDYIDPTISADQFGVSLTREEGESPGVEVAFHEYRYVEWRQTVQDSFARLDSLEAAAAAAERRAQAAARAAAAEAAAAQDTAAGDTTRQAVREGMPEAEGIEGEGRVPEDTVQATAPPARVLPPELPAGTPAEGAPAARRRSGAGAEAGPPLNPDGQPLPSRRIVLRLDGPLEVNVAYQLSVDVVVNLNGIPLGGGEAAVVREPPKDTTAVADTAGTPPDSSLVTEDTIPSDTALVAPDSIPPDTIPPDTSRALAGRQFFLPGRGR
ncbi:MAG TPA: Ig-like domain-containing protein [Longimicrobiales bacterium]|nr:Ig-like domain-containing protein [Longimicrobiales bacterium]